MSAARANRKILIFPRSNSGELATLPDSILSRIDLVPVDRIDLVQKYVGGGRTAGKLDKVGLRRSVSESGA